MADQPVPDLPDAPSEDVPRVMGVRADNSLALTPNAGPFVTTYTNQSLTPVGAWSGAVHFGHLSPLPIYQLTFTLFGATVTYGSGDVLCQGLPLAAEPYTPGTSLKFPLFDVSQGATHFWYLSPGTDGSLAVKAGNNFTAKDLRGTLTWLAPDRASLTAEEIKAEIEKLRLRKDGEQ